jgi:exopolyphosphatase/guanosine-5'-triphosphate,3'-diphosphate pyrophosphatase
MLSLREELAKYNLEDRMEKFQLKPDRADVIIPACDIYSYIFKELDVKSFAVPKIGLSDGIIYDLHLKHIEKEEKVSKLSKKSSRV